MTMKAIINNIIIAGCLALVLGSCTNLDEELFGVVTPETFFRNEEEAFTGLVPVYASIRFAGHYERFRGMSDLSSDAIVVPGRPGWGWEDGGKWIEVAEHNWTPNTAGPSAVYADAFTAIARANSFLENLSNSDAVFDKKDQLLAETRFMRAFCYYILLDFFGNVPIVEAPLRSGDELPGNENATNRPKVAKFVVDEINAIMDDLPAEQTGENFGRITKGAAQMLLARMYLNSSIYFETGSFSNTDLQNVIDITTDIINSGQYNLMDKYLDIFHPDNEMDNPEAVFVIRYGNVGGAASFINRISLSVHPDLPLGGWGGFVVTADALNSFDASDDRINQIVVGEVRDDEGNLVTANNPITGQVEPVIHTPDLVDIRRTGFFEGARLLKWANDDHPSNIAGNDFIVFRLTEAYTMRAEARLRMGDAGGALADINLIRERAFDPDEPLASLNEDILLEELGREYLFEGHRRMDLIRFGKFTFETWQFKTNTDPTRQLFPIPQGQLDTNPNLTQNPGYGGSGG